MRSCVTDIILEGYPLTDILSKLHDDVITRTELSDLDKGLICDKIAQVIFLVISSSSSYLGGSMPNTRSIRIVAIH